MLLRPSVCAQFSVRGSGLVIKGLHSDDKPVGRAGQNTPLMRKILMTVPESIHPAAEMICVSLHLQMHFRISDYVMLLFCVLLHTGHSQMHTVT